MNYINDRLYAGEYVKSQFFVNKKGPNLIKRDLLNKGIDIDIINDSMMHIDNEKISENILYLISYFEKLSKKVSVNKLKNNILRSLINKGYEYDDINALLKDYHFSKVNEQMNLKKEMKRQLQKFAGKYKNHELKNKIIKILLGKGFLYGDIINMYALANTEG